MQRYRKIAARTLVMKVAISKLMALLLLSAITAAWVLTARAANTSSNIGRWTIADIVQIKRIVGTAVLGSTEVSAFIVEAPSLVDDRDHYTLFEVSPGRAPKELAHAAFISNLEWRPGTGDWTIRADFGQGVQLYDVSEAGEVKPLLIIKPLTLVGGHGGLVSSSVSKPRLEGVLSYQWAPDGKHYWYSRVRLRSAAVQERLRHGIIYNDTDMEGVQPSDIRRAIEYAGSELRVVDVRTGTDHLVALHTSGAWSEMTFSDSVGNSCLWVDSFVLQYLITSTPDGVLTFSLWRYDVRTGLTRRVELPGGPYSAFDSLPVPGGFIIAKQTADGYGIYEVTSAGRVLRNFGLTNYKQINIANRGFDRGGMWAGPDYRSWIFAVRRVGVDTADGLILAPSTPAAYKIESVRDSLNECSFNTTLSWGICNRESLVNPPELVSISPRTGRIDVLAQPNAQYNDIAPLHTVARLWRNRFGYVNTGYVTFPRSYVPGRKYPAILITHGWGAQNLFAEPGFQWAFPVQVFPEEGYFVLSVNEPRSRKHQAPMPYLKGAAKSSVAALWFTNDINAMASLDAAAESLVESGQVDPREIGIAGYSRGSETANFIMSHSRVFSAESTANNTWREAGGYWDGGEMGRRSYDSLFGGSPFDVEAFPNYLRYSPSARAREFAGPVLQEYDGYTAPKALELYQLLLHAQIPTEMVVYPDDTHVFYGPRDIAMVMRRNLDWFNYWLLGTRDSHPADPGEYRRWQQMVGGWMACKAECRKKFRFAAPSTDDDAGHRARARASIRGRAAARPVHHETARRSRAAFGAAGTCCSDEREHSGSAATAARATGWGV